MKLVPVPVKRHQSRSAAAVSSGPLPHRPPGDLDRERLPGVLVDDVEQLEDAAVGGLLELEVQRPYLVRPLGGLPLRGHRRVAEALPFAPAGRHPQPFLPPQPGYPLGVDVPAFGAQQRVGPPMPPAGAGFWLNRRSQARSSSSRWTSRW